MVVYGREMRRTLAQTLKRANHLVPAGTERVNMATQVCDLMNGATRLESDKASEEQVSSFLLLWEVSLTRVPTPFKDTIERYWRERVVPESCRQKANVKSVYDPHITLYREMVGDEGAAPKVMLDGHVIGFPATFLDDLGADLTVVAIAHELAHVSFMAQAEPHHWPDSTNSADSNGAERLVDARLLEWGLSQQELNNVDAFLAARGISRFRLE
jgi:hypothetical protein